MYSSDCLPVYQCLLTVCAPPPVQAHVVRVADRLTHSTGVWMVAVVIGDDDSGVELRVNLSNEVCNCIRLLSLDLITSLVLLSVCGLRV